MLAMKNFAFIDRVFSVSITALCFIELIRRYYCEVTLENEIENRGAVSPLGKSGGHLPPRGGLMVYTCIRLLQSIFCFDALPNN